MLTYSDLDPNKKAFIFELDDVLYPQQDYLLQVYYLFANFLEYTETSPPASDLINFLKDTYLLAGQDGIFHKAAEKFGIDKKYEENFNRLHVSAQLPLKLLLYPSVLDLLKSIVKDHKSIFILTKGNPLMQLNKLKYMEWEGLDKELKVYFHDEIKLVSDEEPLDYLINDNSLVVKEIIMIGNSKEEQLIAKSREVDYLDISFLLSSAQ